MKNEFEERIAQVIYDGKWIDADEFTRMHFRSKARDVFDALGDPPATFVAAFHGDSPIEDFERRWIEAIESVCNP